MATLKFEGLEISIHAPRAGGDAPLIAEISPRVGFQSTPPVRGATPQAQHRRRECPISIHAPRAGGDVFCQAERDSGNISIHAPRAGGDSYGVALGFCV